MNNFYLPWDCNLGHEKPIIELLKCSRNTHIRGT
jgi:hypothetical protein